MNDEIDDFIRKKISWEHLPVHIKQVLGNAQKEYDKSIVTFSIKNQLRYRGNLVRNVLKDERRYYERIVAFSRERLMLFPYHLADMIVKGLRITPFIYYVSIVERLIQTDKSYDTLPNFTAADVLRILGIGRNEYIELMNRSRSGRRSLFGRRNVKGFLPVIPLEIHIEPWWRVEVGFILEDDIKMVTTKELQLIDTLIDNGSQTAGDLDYNLVQCLYRKGLIYLDVPITGADRVQVPPLQGFIMNRTLGDYFENLLYKIFVSIDEHMTVSELAAVLQVDTESVKQAVSLYCRLGFARKLNADPEWDLAKRHSSWNNRTALRLQQTTPITPLTLDLHSYPSTHQLSEGITPTQESPSTSSLRNGQRVAFLFDSTLTAFLMMGNLSHGLKSHAVTMFEVGKLSDESLDGLIAELDKVSLLDAEGEGEARRYFDHAVILRATVLALRNLLPSGLDLVRCESLHSLDAATCSRLLKKKYKLLVSMAPLSRDVHPICSISPPHLGPARPEVNSIWFKLFIYHMTGYGPPSLLLSKGTILKYLPRMFLGFGYLLITPWRHEPAVIPASSISHINSTLRYSAVLIQAYGVHKSAITALVPFPITQDITTNKKNASLGDYDWNNHPAMNNLGEIVDMKHSCGFVTVVKIGVRDLGCETRDPIVKLGRLHQSNHPGKAILTPTCKQNKIASPVKSEAMCISNENFYFSNKKTTKVVEKVSSDLFELQPPLETHFANSPVARSKASSPANGVISQESNSLLCQELDQLETDDKISIQNTDKPNVKPSLLNLDSSSFDSLLSPNDENISMFSCISNKNNDGVKSIINIPDNIDQPAGEEWTLFDCCFGIPLFDVDANTQICHSIISKEFTQPASLEKLTISNERIGSLLSDFINQCQYYPNETRTLTKGSRIVPQPRINLVFDNGKVQEWSGK